MSLCITAQLSRLALHTHNFQAWQYSTTQNLYTYLTCSQGTSRTNVGPAEFATKLSRPKPLTPFKKTLLISFQKPPPPSNLPCIQPKHWQNTLMASSPSSASRTNCTNQPKFSNSQWIPAFDPTKTILTLQIFNTKTKTFSICRGEQTIHKKKKRREHK